MSKGIGIAVSCVAVALGCSGASSKSGGLTADARSFCMAIIDATANHQYACQGGSRDAVNAQVRALDYCNGVATVIGASHVTFDAEVAAACLADIAGFDCWQNAYASDNCRNVFTGTVPEGGVCYQAMTMGAQECAPGTVCIGAATDCTGTCMASTIMPRLVAIGMPCTGSAECVGDNGALTCVGPDGPIASGSGTCQPPAATGPCYFDSDCSTSFCSGATGTAAGTCQAAKHVGDACEPSAGQCGPGTWCVVDTCIELPSVGQQCGGDSGLLRECLDGYCDSNMMCARYGRKDDLCQPLTANACGEGPGVNECDGTNLQCTPVCAPGNGCGAPRQMCCSGQRCNAGSTCVDRVCT